MLKGLKQPNKNTYTLFCYIDKPKQTNEAAYLQSLFQINLTFYLNIPQKALVKVNNNNNNNNNTFILYSDNSKVENRFTMTMT